MRLMTLQGFFKKGFDMSFFKRSKTKKFLESLKKENMVVIMPDVPEVIKESKIKPTKCKYCKSTYQAKHKHIKGEQSIEFIRPIYKLLAQCPICKNFNEVEFEEDAE